MNRREFLKGCAVAATASVIGLPEVAAGAPAAAAGITAGARTMPGAFVGIGADGLAYPVWVDRTCRVMTKALMGKKTNAVSIPMDYIQINPIEGTTPSGFCKFVKQMKREIAGFPLSREWQKESRNEKSVKPVAKIVSKWANLR